MPSYIGTESKMLTGRKEASQKRQQQIRTTKKHQRPSNSNDSIFRWIGIHENEDNSGCLDKPGSRIEVEATGGA